jgi:hypothetical protein
MDRGLYASYLFDVIVFTTIMYIIAQESFLIKNKKKNIIVILFCLG